MRTPLITGKVASTTGTAPRSPAHPSTSRSRALYGRTRSRRRSRSGLATSIMTTATSVPSSSTSPSWLGNTSSPRVRKRAICATQASPSWKAVIVRLAGNVGAAERQPGQVDGEKARAVEDRRSAVGDRRRRDRGDRDRDRGGEVDPLERPDRGEPDRHPDRQPDPELAHRTTTPCPDPVARLLDPVDEPEHEQDRNRIVEPGLGLERACQLPLQGGASQEGEDRRSIRGRQNRAEQESLERREVEQPGGHQPGDQPRSRSSRRERARSRAARPAGSRRSPR